MLGILIGAAVGAGLMKVAAIVLSAIGFKGAGIAAASIAAKMMSAAAITNGGGVAAGSLVATLQSMGAAGISATYKIFMAIVGAVIGALF